MATLMKESIICLFPLMTTLAVGYFVWTFWISSIEEQDSSWHHHPALTDGCIYDMYVKVIITIKTMKIMGNLKFCT